MYSEEQLRGSDAHKTIGVRTNIGYTSAGYNGKICRIELMINGGEEQPGCGLVFMRSCSHARAYQVYAEIVEKEYLGRTKKIKF